MGEEVAIGLCDDGGEERCENGGESELGGGASKCVCGGCGCVGVIPPVSCEPLCCVRVT